MAYCRWRGHGVRLLTESEWERAAAGTGGHPFPWGDEPPAPERLNFTPAAKSEQEKHKSLQHATPVGFYPIGATEEGILDLAGNVFEWCTDEWTEHFRVVRGGCFASTALFVRSAFRGRYPPDRRADHIGFRVCRSTDW